MTCAQGIAAGLWVWYTNAATQLETIPFEPAACARERLVHFLAADIGLVQPASSYVKYKHQATNREFWPPFIARIVLQMTA